MSKVSDRSHALLLTLPMAALAAVTALAGCTDSGPIAGSIDGTGEARQSLLGAELPLLSDAAAALSAPLTTSALATSDAAAARRPRPPVDPLLELARGRWLGTCDILLTGQTEPAISVEIERITEPTGVPGEMTWTLIYRDASGEQVRPYVMRADPAVAGRYIFDENNGILISNYLQGGNLLYSDFEVQGIRLRTRDEFRNNRYEFEIGIGATTPEIVSDLGDGFIVNSYRVLNTQKCSMRKVRGHGHD